MQITANQQIGIDYNGCYVCDTCDQFHDPILHGEPIDGECPECAKLCTQCGASDVVSEFEGERICMGCIQDIRELNEFIAAQQAA